MGFNFTSVKARINAIIGDLLADGGLATTVTYRKDLGVQWNPSLSRNVAAYSDTAVSAIRTKHNRRSVNIAQAKVEEGDIAYFFQNSDMPVGMTLNDQIIDSGDTYKIKDIQDLFGVAYVVTVYSGA